MSFTIDIEVLDRIIEGMLISNVVHFHESSKYLIAMQEQACSRAKLLG